MSEMVEMTEVIERTESMDVPVNLNMSDGMDLAEMPSISPQVDENRGSLLTGRKRQRSGSVTPEEPSPRDNFSFFNGQYEQNNSNEDRAALLLRVYLKMKLGK